MQRRDMQILQVEESFLSKFEKIVAFLLNISYTERASRDIVKGVIKTSGRKQRGGADTC
ncbi:MAG: hypothetical protein OSJ73_02655 [Lachnospiraceae bacterium]|nr:hypothetical protein [Lachnospiraceae bacterium]